MNISYQFFLYIVADYEKKYLSFKKFYRFKNSGKLSLNLLPYRWFFKK